MGSSGLQQGQRSRAVFVGLVAALAVALLGLAGGAARATASFTLTRLAGGDRFSTAAAIATSTFTQADAAVIASGRDFPDALAGSYLAGRLGAPVLLSEPSSVPAATLTALQQLGVHRVVLLGGEGALSAAVFAAFGAGGFTVSRVSGPDRFATAAAVAREGGAPPSHTALLASGRGFADALSAGPIAYGSAIPELLTEPSTLSPAAATALTDLGVTNVVVLGGSGAVSDTVVSQLQQLGFSVARLAGGDRYATSVAIADWAVGALGHGRDHVDVATGADFPDALAGGAHAGSGRHTILLTETGSAVVDGEAVAYLQGHQSEVTAGHVFGGTGAVDDATVDALERAGQGVDPNPPNECESTIFGLVQQARAAAGVAPLADSSRARLIAHTWSAQMALTGGLSHNPATPTLLQVAGINWRAWAENVAFGPTPEAVHTLLMNSPVHRDNILSTAVDHVGVGCVADTTGVLWVTEVFYA
jgi:putative cell wall-binding protein